VRALVIGASGAVGSVVAATLRGWGHKVTPAGRRAPDDGIALDLNANDLDPFRQAVQVHDVIVNASGVENPSVGGATGSATFIDVRPPAPTWLHWPGRHPMHPWSWARGWPRV
jgi:putative NADH-flavin reductase